jgi:hypothetical protein
MYYYYLRRDFNLRRGKERALRCIQELAPLGHSGLEARQGTGSAGHSETVSGHYIVRSLLSGIIVGVQVLCKVMIVKHVQNTTRRVLCEQK